MFGPPTSIPALRDLLAAHGLQPKKSLGQNFLVSENLLKAIVRAADVQPTDVVIEVGPGVGTLTHQLALAAQHVIAVELDQNMLAILRETLAAHQNVTLIHADVLKVNLAEILGAGGQGLRGGQAMSHEQQTVNREQPAFDGDQTPIANFPSPITHTPRPTSHYPTSAPQPPLPNLQPYKVVANLPYYITSAVIRKFLDAPHKPLTMTLMTQLEVARRIVAPPGDLSLLAVSVQFYATPTLVMKLPAGAFYPAPKVDSAVVRMDVRETRPDVAVDKFFETVQAGFGQKRKQLRNSLAAGLRLTNAQSEALLRRAGIDAQRRAQTLTIEEWIQLTNAR